MIVDVNPQGDFSLSEDILAHLHETQFTRNFWLAFWLPPIFLSLITPFTLIIIHHLSVISHRDARNCTELKLPLNVGSLELPQLSRSWYQPGNTNKRSTIISSVFHFAMENHQVFHRSVCLSVHESSRLTAPSLSGGYFQPCADRWLALNGKRFDHEFNYAALLGYQ